ncbi:MAG: DUF4080 domain-containing protein [Granulosicoccus sp.]
MSDITLATINARYIHASLGLRYLLANMGTLQARTRIREYTLNQRPEDIAESLLNSRCRIVGFGVYIWNVLQTTEVIKLLKVVKPELVIVVGGPEVSFETTDQTISALADHVVIGPADTAFAELCQEILDGDNPVAVTSALPVDLQTLESPYPYYSDDDIAHRVLYVEASRGCPFKCEFCLSSLDKTALAFPLPEFLQQMQLLIDRGARHFKFVDRTFNLKTETSRQILEFFLTHIDKGLFLHFELIPDRLPETLQKLLPRFPPGSLQFEIGIQTFNPVVQKLISRKQQHEKTCENLRWLRNHTQAHIHADLIFGLPGENLESFASGFDLLYSLAPQEIQVGILKRLRGTPITRHTQTYDMRYMTSPPYRILAHRDADFETHQRMVRFARYWDLVANSGRFPNSLPLILGDNPFKRFMSLSDWIFSTSEQTHRIALPRLLEFLWRSMTTLLDVDAEVADDAARKDFKHNRLKGVPVFLADADLSPPKAGLANGSQRQQRHAGG